jgi:hypothetical protein
MKTKISAYLALFSLLFLFADSRYKILFFDEKLNSSTSSSCRVIDNLRELSTALESKSIKEIDLGIKKVRFNLTVAYSLETGLSGFESKSNSEEESKLSRDLDLARKEFNRFKSLEESEISSKIPLVQESLKMTEELLKPYC